MRGSSASWGIKFTSLPKLHYQIKIEIIMLWCAFAFINRFYTPPTSAGPEAEWCGWRNGRWGQQLNGTWLATD